MNFVKIGKPYYKNLSVIFTKEILKHRNKNIFLTGGNTFKKIYKNMNFNSINRFIEKKNFFITDERMKVDLKKTNYLNIYDNFLKKNNIKNFHYINFEVKNLKKEIKRYEKKLPPFPDLIFLSLGQFGHVASVYKKSKLLSSRKKVGLKKKTKYLETRISLSMRYMNKSKKIVLVVGPNKTNELRNFIKKNDYCPASRLNKKNICIYIYDKKYKKNFDL